MGSRAEPAAPKPEADIVMRGGISSGVVYPGVLVRLAERYRLCEIGGASAGAIAAGMAAAAQYGVDNGQHDAFTGVLKAIPEEVGGARAHAGGTSFRRLFATHPDLAPLGDLLWCLVGHGGWKGWLMTRLGGVLGGPMLAVALAAGALLLLVARALWRGALAMPPSGAAGLLLALALLVALSAAVVPPALLLVADLLTLAFRSGLIDKFRANGFGLTNGVAPGLWESARLPEPADIMQRGALADWMHLKIQQAAGLALDDPLTMAHLWAGKPPPPGVTAWDERRIDLVLTTTNLSHQVPHRFPFLEKPGMRLYFRRDDLERVLPRPVVEAMVDRALRNRSEHADSGDPDRLKLVETHVISTPDGVEHFRLPRPEQLPVLLGVRLSLSFPGLVSAVRFHAWRCDDTSERGDRDREGRPRLQPCLFSDGGITSNFPITVFDEPLPRRPTFCVNLADLGPGEDRSACPDQRVTLDAIDDPARYQKIAPEWRLDPDPMGPGGFVMAIVDTARNAHENDLMTAPVARARIVTIKLDPEREGGLNLDMDAATVERLSHYGEVAAERLTHAFLARPAPADALGKPAPTEAWRAHRTLRMRTTLAAVESFVTSYAESWQTADATGLRYKETLADVIAGLGPDRPAFSATKRGRRLARLARLMAEAAARPNDSLYDGRRNPADPTSLNRKHQGPRPRMGLKLSPTGSQDPLRG